MKVLVLLLVALHPLNSMRITRSYGEKCESGEHCSGSHVTCQASTGTCDCLSPYDMIYDHSVKDCVVTLGKFCNSDKKCIDGAFCDNGICKCESGFFPSSSEGICMPRKAYLEKCSDDVECGGLAGNGQGNQHRPQICQDGVCQCDRRTDAFSEKHGLCLGLVDTECHNILKPGSESVKHYFNACTEHSECRKGPLTGKFTCQCQQGFAKTSDGRCSFGHGRSCDSTKKGKSCADMQLICLDGKCTCRYPIHQIYDERSKECLSLVNGPCTFPLHIMNFTRLPDFQRCVKNSHCVDKGFYSECECNPGYEPTKSGNCVPSFGHNCEPGECDPDGVTQLFCRNGVCDCADFLQVFDTSGRRCRGLVGAKCTKELPFCVEYASCVIPDPNLPGKCDNYSTETTNRTCDYSKTVSKALSQMMISKKI